MSNLRIGHGYDVHHLTEGRPLILGGVRIEHAKGLLGHSDADVLVHAVMDALLGAAGLPDIGAQFPPSDETYRDADSCELLAQVRQLMRAAGFNRIVNIDCTIMAERPKLAPHIPAMRERIARAVATAPETVNIKATTTEGLGFVGREEGIAASAVCLIAANE